MTPRVTFIRTDADNWRRETNCDVPSIGDTVRMINNYSEMEILAFTVIAVQRDFIDVAWGENSGNLLRHDTVVTLKPIKIN